MWIAGFITLDNALPAFSPLQLHNNRHHAKRIFVFIMCLAIGSAPEDPGVPKVGPPAPSGNREPLKHAWIKYSFLGKISS